MQAIDNKATLWINNPIITFIVTVQSLAPTN